MSSVRRKEPSRVRSSCARPTRSSLRVLLAALALALAAADTADDAGEDARRRAEALRLGARPARGLHADELRRGAGQGDGGAAARVAVKRPGKMRWEYAQPDGRVIVLDEKAIRIWNPEEKQLQIAKLASAERLADRARLPDGAGRPARHLHRRARSPRPSAPSAACACARRATRASSRSSSGSTRRPSSCASRSSWTCSATARACASTGSSRTRASRRPRSSSKRPRAPRSSISADARRNARSCGCIRMSGRQCTIEGARAARGAGVLTMPRRRIVGARPSPGRSRNLP